ncbi:class I SAM-dependent methyltransferase [Ruania halotolerans]|uniref:class I SAM-dependent methyltransferase n=1 Tax=Ruania halotolerans TaxID=2897773 RepID=UPI001E34E52E|nr:methyltransferase [Ruania halotolerans]UFU05149.1 class I SAM-dependent methyltransferase [Ruania halotolerans]
MSHYFSSPEGPGRRRTLTVTLRGTPVTVQVDRGVFSGDRLDPGTTVLLDAVGEPPPSGNLLDLGCGWGPIALALAQASSSARVLAVDVNERALELTRENAAAAGLDHVEAWQPAALLAAEPELRLDALWSNPPIRIGKAALHEILQTWLPRVRPGAQAHVVVQKHLGSDSLHRWIAETLELDVVRLTSVKGYRVLQVTGA